MFKGAGLVIFLGGLLLSNLSVFAAQDVVKKVFIVASYEEDNVCGKPQAEGAIKALAREGWILGENLHVEYYFMDTKNTHSSLQAIKEQGTIAKSKVEAFAPDVLITLDDNAFREVGLSFNQRKDISVVFSGLNGFPENYDKKIDFMNSRQHPEGNITGVYEKLYVNKSIAVIQSALQQSGARKIIAIVDYTPTGNALTAQLEAELEETKNSGEFEWQLVRVSTWEEYVKVVEKANTDQSVLAIYPLALALKDAQGSKYNVKKIFDWTIENSKKPEMALNYFFSKIGLFGGAAVDFKSMGFEAGLKASQILSGTSAGNISIDDAPEYAIVFNLKRAKQLGIKISSGLLTAADFIYE